MNRELFAALALDGNSEEEARVLFQPVLQRWRTQPRLATSGLRALARFPNTGPQAALRLLRAMGRQRLEVNGFHLSAAMAGGDWQVSLFLLADFVEGSDVKARNAAMASCEKASAWQAACLLLEADVISYNTCISSCAKGSEWRSGLQLLEEMRAILAPDLVTYNSALLACGRAGQWTAAVALLEDLTRAQLQADGFTFPALISACEERWEVALLFLKEQSSPSELSWNTAISACDKGLQWQRALALLAAMPRARLRGDVVSFNSALSACSRCEQWITAVQLLREMMQDRLSDAVSYGAVMMGLQWREALEMLAHLRPMDLSEVSCGACITACGRSRRWREAVALLLSMPLLRLEPSVGASNAAISACEQEWEIALELLRTHAHGLSDLSLASAMRACSEGSQWRSALAFAAALAAKGAEGEGKRGLVAWGGLITACEKGEQWQLAIHFLGDMLQQQVFPDLIACNAAISACEKAARWQPALSVLQQIMELRLCPNETSFNAALSACDRAMRQGMALG
ncbi:unnamed protein product [Effrenium voratum]|nr:unnamed protein product [Effrenium voratum]